MRRNKYHSFPNSSKWCATELEGMAIYLSIMHYAPQLFGRHFTIRTDHRALVALLRSKMLINRLYGWMLKIQAYDFVIEYHPGRQNVVADAFSRQFWSSSEQVYSEMDVKQGKGVAGESSGEGPHSQGKDRISGLMPDIMTSSEKQAGLVITSASDDGCKMVIRDCGVPTTPHCRDNLP